MITRRTTTRLIAGAQAFGLFQDWTSVGFISDPSGLHLQIHLDGPALASRRPYRNRRRNWRYYFDRVKKTLAPREIRTYRDPGGDVASSVISPLAERIALESIRIERALFIRYVATLPILFRRRQ